MEPEFGALSVSNGDIFSWTEVSNISSYTLEIDESNLFPDPIYRISGIAGTSHIPDIDLRPDSDYWWRVIAKNQCGQSIAPAFQFSTATTTSIPNLSAGNITLFPNPAHLQATISVTDQDRIQRLELINMSGQVVYIDEPLARSTAVDLSPYPPALYQVIIYKGHNIYQDKIVKY